MWRRSPGRRGFTLIEVLVVMLSLVIIVVAVGQLLFDTQKATQRQQYQVDARQTARATADYVTFLLRGATDMNMPTVVPPLPNNPGSVLIWYWVGTWASGNNNSCPGAPGTGACVQATWDNVTDSSCPGCADLGTDIITFGRVDNVQIYYQVGGGFSFDNVKNESSHTVNFYPALCAGPNGNSANALAYFQQTTGYTSASNPSPVMVIADTLGRWGFFQITSYPASGSDVCSPICSNKNGVAQPCVTVGTHIGVASTVNPPGNPNPTGDDDAVRLFAGVRYTSLRVCQGWLEQKDGMFDPGSDGTGALGTGANACSSNGWNTAPWTPILPNVEDLQLAYIYNNDGASTSNPASIWNSSAQTLPTTIHNVPTQAGPGAATLANDVTNVVGIRVTVTARSVSSVPQEQERFRKQPAENNPHDGTINAADTQLDKFYRFQASEIAMLRGRNPGS